MRNRQKNTVSPHVTNQSSAPPAIVSELIALATAAQWQQLEAKASLATMRYPAQLFVWKALGIAFLNQSKLQRALDTFIRIVKFAPGDADSHNYLGVIYRNLGRLAEAETAFRRSLEIASGPLDTHTNRSLALSNLGLVLSDLGRHTESVACHQQALEIRPDVAETYNNLGTALRDNGNLDAAVAAYRKALNLAPAYFDASFNLGVALQEMGQLYEAEIEYRRAMEINPNSAIVLRCLGALLGRYLGKHEEGLALLERAIVLDAASPDIHIELGNLLQVHGQAARGWEMFRHAQALRPLTTWLARDKPAKFSVVALDTPGAGSTPFEYLLRKSEYDVNFYCVIPGVRADVELLHNKGEVVINLIADADSGKDILAAAGELADRIGRPVVNHPHRIMGTDRESMSQRLVGAPGFCSPLTKRYSGAALAEAASNGGLAAFKMPVLARYSGTHGGDDLEKYNDYAKIATFASGRPDADYYLTEFIDFRSADGYFRKYRLIYVDGQLFPYHLAIHTEWKVHYFRTNMENQSWMRQEEETFLNDPNSVIDADRYEKLRKIVAETGLDYCGIDCAITASGELLVFEANATMLVHDEKQAVFFYKNPAARMIKQAYDAMLNRMVLKPPV